MTVATARALRRRMTDAERLLWRELRSRAIGGIKFRRQQPIGAFIADFACWNARLVVEIDGGQHSADHDAERTRAIQAEGWQVIRFWNNDVLANPEAVLLAIVESAQARLLR
jgi:very-short-patch-repair endonuclease